jgi:hypothetical protein
LERRFGLVLLATLVTAMLPLTWEDRKAVWFVMAALVGLSKAQVLGRGEAGWQLPQRRAVVVRPTLAPRPVKPMAGPRRNLDRDAPA